jgi:hypothetical protein
MTKLFPDNCLRSLKKQDWIKEGQVSTDAFLSDPRTAESRVDRGREVSINWEDNERAIGYTFSQKIQSGHGIAKLPKCKIDTIQTLKSGPAQINYERKDAGDNTFHGNLVYSATCNKPAEKLIASALALASEFIPRPETLLNNEAPPLPNTNQE